MDYGKLDGLPNESLARSLGEPAGCEGGDQAPHRLITAE
jgi:hypothetical protein